MKGTITIIEVIKRKTDTRRLTRYFLIRWRRYSENLSNPICKRDMKLLYSGLAILEDRDKKLLWDKYYRLDATKPFTDKEMAMKYGIPVKEFSERRIDIETRMSEVINDFADKQRKE